MRLKLVKVAKITFSSDLSPYVFLASSNVLSISQYFKSNFKFFELDFTIKINVKKERRFDRSTVIFTLRKNCCYIKIMFTSNRG